MTLPIAAPKAEPDAKVANAKDRAREGGNAWAKIPSWVIERLEYENGY